MKNSDRSVVIRSTAAFVAAALLLTIAGCGVFGSRSDEMPMEALEKEMQYDSAPAPSAPSMAAGRSADMVDEMAASEGASPGMLTGMLTGITAVEAAPADRKVIKTADLDLEVRQLEGAQQQIIEAVDRHNGFISSLTVSDYGTSRQAEVIVRIPSDHFREVYDAIRALGRVTRDYIGGQDVTEEYMDLERRIANLEAQEARVREMFNDAKTVEDLLKVEQRLTEVRGQIEQYQGRLRYLKDQVGFSTITISLYQPGDAPIEAQNGWEIAYHLRGAWLALVEAFRGLVYGIIWIVVAGAVVWIPLLIVILVIRNWAIRRRAERAAEEEPPTS